MFEPMLPALATLAVVTARAPRIGIVVTDAYAVEDPDHDTPLLLAALRALGARAEAVVWHRSTDWSEFDLLLLRSPWDYPRRIEEFRRWLDVAGAATRVLNTPALVRWNLDKRYLADLAEHGIAVVPTSYHRDPALLADALDAHAANAACDLPARVVVKPTVGAGAHLTGLFQAGDPAALALAQAVLDGGASVMLQPEIPELTSGEEKAVYLIEGEVTHAIAKGALLEVGGRLRGGVYQEDPQRVEVTPAEVAFATRVLDAVVAATGEERPLYARIDLVETAERGILLLEAELVEPALNLHVAPEVTSAIARAVLDRLPR